MLSCLQLLRAYVIVAHVLVRLFHSMEHVPHRDCGLRVFKWLRHEGVQSALLINNLTGERHVEKNMQNATLHFDDVGWGLVRFQDQSGADAHVWANDVLKSVAGKTTDGKVFVMT